MSEKFDYLIMWHSRGYYLLNLTIHDQQHTIDILMEKAEAKWVSNPVRDMIITIMTDDYRGAEIWTFSSNLGEDEFESEWLKDNGSVKDEIRSCGEFIYGKI